MAAQSEAVTLLALAFSHSSLPCPFVSCFKAGGSGPHAVHDASVNKSSLFNLPSASSFFTSSITRVKIYCNHLYVPCRGQASGGGWDTLQISFKSVTEFRSFESKQIAASEHTRTI